MLLPSTEQEANQQENITWSRGIFMKKTEAVIE
jgi:hypothetical protein